MNIEFPKPPDGTDNWRFYASDSESTASSALGSFKIDPAIPPDEIRLRNKDGRTIGKLTNVGEATMNPTLQAAHDLFSQHPDPNQPRKGEHWIDWANRRRLELQIELYELEQEELRGPKIRRTPNHRPPFNE